MAFNSYDDNCNNAVRMLVGVEKAFQREKAEKKEDVMRLVEAQIAGSVDLSPEEMVDAAFLIVERIDGRLNGKV